MSKKINFEIPLKNDSYKEFIDHFSVILTNHGFIQERVASHEYKLKELRNYISVLVAKINHLPRPEQFLQFFC
jgi:hypothetical protein